MKLLFPIKQPFFIRLNDYQPPKKSPLDDRANEIQRLYHTGHSFGEIVRTLSLTVSRAAVRKFCLSRGFKVESPDRVRWRLGLCRRNIAQALFKGVGVNRIASLNNVSEKILARYIRETNLTADERRKRRRSRPVEAKLNVLHDEIMGAHSAGQSVRQITFMVFGDYHGAHWQRIADYIHANTIVSPKRQTDCPPSPLLNTMNSTTP